MKTTLRDVAQVAGVSAMTVSSVLNGTGRNVRVSEETAKRIREVARQLKYSPNRFATGFRSGKTRTVGVVLQHFERLSDDNPYYPLLLNGIMAALFPADYTLAFCPKLVQHGDISAIVDGRFDGVLWARPDFTAGNVDSLREAHLPLVMLHAPPGSAEGIPTYCADNRHALGLVVEHFISLGHRRCAFVIDQLNENSAEGLFRASAFREAITEQGVEGDVLVWDDTTEGLTTFINGDLKPTALVCFSDALAGRILIASAELGIRVPADLSVVGFDSTAFCDRLTPRLTSVFQPVETMAYDATVQLLKLIDGEEVGENSESLFQCHLTLRESTAVAPAQGLD